MGDILAFTRPPRRPPRVPRPRRAPIAYGSALEVLASFAVALAALAIVALLWVPIILAGVWLFKRLHHH